VALGAPTSDAGRRISGSGSSLCMHTLLLNELLHKTARNGIK